MPSTSKHLPGVRASGSLDSLRSSSKFGFPYPFVRDVHRGQSLSHPHPDPLSSKSNPNAARKTVGEWTALAATLNPSTSSDPSALYTKPSAVSPSNSSPSSTKRQLPSYGKHLVSKGKVYSRVGSGVSEAEGRLFGQRARASRIPASLLPAESLEKLNENCTVVMPCVVARHAYNGSNAAKTDLGVVERWMKHMLEEVKGSEVTQEEQFDDALRIYHIAVHEICRQVMAEAFDRGDFLLRTWVDYTKLVSRSQRHLRQRFTHMSQEAASFKSAFCEMQLENCDLRRIVDSLKDGKDAQALAKENPRMSAYGRATLKELRREGTARRKSQFRKTDLRRRSSVFSQKTLKQLNAEEESEGVDIPAKKALFDEFFKSLDQDLGVSKVEDRQVGEDGENGGKRKQIRRLDEEEELRLRVQMLEEDLQNSLARIQSDEAEIDRLEESIANLIQDGRTREHVLGQARDELTRLKAKVVTCEKHSQTCQDDLPEGPTPSTPAAHETVASSTDTSASPSAAQAKGGSNDTSKSKKGGRKKTLGVGKASGRRGKNREILEYPDSGRKTGFVSVSTRNLSGTGRRESIPWSAEVLKGQLGQGQEVSWVLKSVEGFHQSFLRAGLDERPVQQPLREMLLEHYLKKLGLPSVATRHLNMLAVNLFHYQTHPSVSTFFRLYDGKIRPESLSFCLKVRRLCCSTSSSAELSLGVGEEHGGKPSKPRLMFPQDPDGVENWVCLYRAGRITEHMLHGLNACNLDAVAKKLAKYSTTGPCEAWASSLLEVRQVLDKTPRIHVDVLIHVLLEEHFILLKKQNKFFQQLFVEGDTNKDGVLSFSEFQDIVHTVTTQLGSDEVVSMFREAIMHPKNADSGVEDAMTSQAFAQVCQDHNLQLYLHQLEDEEGTFTVMRAEEGDQNN